MRNQAANIFFALAMVGFVDMAVQAATKGEVKLIQSFLSTLFQ